ncbi:calcium-binding protein [Ciceribacter sp. L1K23]|uniref:calcium-binding protein n=1 Tax=Ciceribacter sp. L1K23 TaxID=2820276 RepID=UPI001B81ED4E|nr:calcium-binding protein [Ciceribacter sp. L1K23]MBR0556784.1 calcium-binding protein [Ciceribacter sp. L1K23]
MGQTFRGTSGADRFVQGNTSSTIEFRLFTLGGNDTIIINRSDDLGGGNFVDAGSGNDRVTNAKEAGNDIRLGSGNDTYVGTGFGSFGSDIGDVVRGGDGNDFIAVSTFKSRYFGDAGNDKFASEGWQNVFNGGSGRDRITYEPRDDSSTLGGSGVTIDLATGLAQTGNNRFETLISIEDAAGTNANDAINGTNGANKLEGLNGNDLLLGLGGNDQLFGGRGNDELHGGSGNDVLVGGLGRDVLTGGSGADRFDFNARNESATSTTNRDIITDFSRAQGDRIDLSGIDANTTRSGNQAFNFIGNDAFSAAGQLRFANGFVSGDTNGDGVADFQIDMNGLASISRGDFIL